MVISCLIQSRGWVEQILRSLTATGYQERCHQVHQGAQWRLTWYPVVSYPTLPGFNFCYLYPTRKSFQNFRVQGSNYTCCFCPWLYQWWQNLSNLPLYWIQKYASDNLSEIQTMNRHNYNFVNMLRMYPLPYPLPGFFPPPYPNPTRSQKALPVTACRWCCLSK